MKKKPVSAVVKARFCACDAEPLPSKPGMAVYLKARGVLTLNAAEASKTYPQALGEIDANYSVKFNAMAERALELCG